MSKENKFLGDFKSDLKLLENEFNQKKNDLLKNKVKSFFQSSLSLSEFFNSDLSLLHFDILAYAILNDKITGEDFKNKNILDVLVRLIQRNKNNNTKTKKILKKVEDYFNTLDIKSKFQFVIYTNSLSQMFYLSDKFSDFLKDEFSISSDYEGSFFIHSIDHRFSQSKITFNIKSTEELNTVAQKMFNFYQLGYHGNFPIMCSLMQEKSIDISNYETVQELYTALKSKIKSIKNEEAEEEWLESERW